MHCHIHYKDERLEWAVYEYDEDFAALSSLCTSSQTEYAVENFKSGKRRCEWLATRLALRELSGNDICVAYTSEGKPYREDGEGYLSLSHSGHFVAVALHKDCDIGIDVELRSSRIAAIRGRVLSDVEEKGLDRCSEADALLLHWSAKESFYKIIGNMGGSFTESFRISPFKVVKNGSFGISYIKAGETLKRCSVGYLVSDEFVVTCCVDSFQEVLSLPCNQKQSK